MAKEICSSNQFTASYLSLLNQLADQVKTEYSVNISFAEIFGNRWSYIAGSSEQDYICPPVKVNISSNLGLISCDLNNLTEKKQEEIIERIKGNVDTFN